MGAQLASAHSALNMKLLVVLALRPSLPLSLKPRQRLIPTTDILATAMVLATATVLATDATTMARGRLRLRLPPRLMLILTFCMVDMVLDMVILATATVLATGDTTGDKLPTT